jgi:hypothetical protein
VRDALEGMDRSVACSGFDPTKNSVFFRCHECASELERKQREAAERCAAA